MVSGISQVTQAAEAAATVKPSESGPDFLSHLQTAFDQVEQLQGEADQQIAGLLNGQGTDIHKTMIAVEKASLSFQLMMQVRNKIVQAYQEVSRTAF